MAKVEAHNAENMWKAIASGSRLLEVGSMFRIAQDCYLFGGKLFLSSFASKTARKLFRKKQQIRSWIPSRTGRRELRTLRETPSTKFSCCLEEFGDSSSTTGGSFQRHACLLGYESKRLAQETLLKITLIFRCKKLASFGNWRMILVETD